MARKASASPLLLSRLAINTQGFHAWCRAYRRGDIIAVVQQRRVASSPVRHHCDPWVAKRNHLISEIHHHAVFARPARWLRQAVNRYDRYRQCCRRSKAQFCDPCRTVISAAGLPPFALSSSSVMLRTYFQCSGAVRCSSVCGVSRARKPDLALLLFAFG